MNASRWFTVVKHLSNAELDTLSMWHSSRTRRVSSGDSVSSRTSPKARPNNRLVQLSAFPSRRVVARHTRGIKTGSKAYGHASAAGGSRSSAQHSGTRFAHSSKMANRGLHARSMHSSKTTTALPATRRILLGNCGLRACTTLIAGPVVNQSTQRTCRNINVIHRTGVGPLINCIRYT